MAKALTHNPRTWRRLLPIGVYALLALVVLGPLLAPGYILTLDMAFTPDVRLPETIRASYLFYAVLHVLNIVVPGDVLQKIMLFLILLLSGIGMHRLVRHLSESADAVAPREWGAYIAGAVYMINPFTYSRLMAGQYAVLLGYMLLPFFVLILVRFLAQPNTRNMLRLTALLVAISIVSIHTLGLAIVIGLVALILAGWKYGAADNRNHLARIGRMSVLGLGIFVAASAYWLLPLIRGTSGTAATIESFGAGDQAAFATTGETLIAKLGNVLSLHGFWGEDASLYLLPSDEHPMLRLLIIPFLVLVIWGGTRLWKQHRFVTAVLMISGLIGALLAAGIGTGWLSAHVPFFAGYREPHKFAALVALTYAVFGGYGTADVFSRVRQSRIKMQITAISLAALIIAITPLMFWGSHNQLTARQYPADWYAANDELNRDTSQFSVLFLPWHLYMSFDFNERIVVNPAHDFFDKPTLVNDDLEFGGASPNTHDPTKQAIGQILRQAQGRTDLGARLASFDIKYVMLAQGTNSETYEYLDKQTDLELISEGDSLRMYRNSAWQKGDQ